MALVGEAGRRRDLGQRRAAGDQLLRAGQTAADLEAVGRGAVGRTEMAGQREAVEAAHLLELLRGDDARGFGDQEVAGAFDGAMGGRLLARPWRPNRRGPTSSSATRPTMASAAIGSSGRGKSAKASFSRPARAGSSDTTSGTNGVAAAPSAALDRAGIDIEHAIGEALVDAGVAVMRLVGMDHHHLAGRAGPEVAAIVERLGAPQGQADGVGLVAVQVVGMAAEARGQPLQAAVAGIDLDTIDTGMRS